MKKLFTFCLLAILAVSAKAVDNTDISAYDNVMYGVDAVGQIGGIAKVQIWAKADVSTVQQQGYQFNIQLPAGWTVEETSQEDATISSNYTVYSNAAKTTFQLSTSKGAADLVTTPVNCITTLYVNVPSDVTPGDYAFAVTYAKLSDYGGNSPEVNEHIVSTITVQRPEVFEPMSDANYALEVIPFEAVEGSSTLAIKLKAPNTLKDISFDIELPQGLMFYDSEFETSTVSLASGVTTKTPTVKFAGTNTGAVATRKYFNAQETLTTIATIPVYVVPSAEIGDWGDDYALASGLSKIKLTNITLVDYANASNKYTGEYIASVFNGTSDDTDPILYGHFTDEATALLSNLPEAKSIDMSVATVDNEEKVAKNDVIVYVNGQTKYARAQGTSNFGTICVPFELTSDSNIQYYTVSAVSSESISLVATATVAANEPAIFEYKSGDLAASTASIAYATAPGTKAIDAFTLTGVYEKGGRVEAGEGYYIAKDKFWNDGADVNPYRAYLAGPAGVKALRIQIEDETGIRDITDELEADGIYDLSGRKLDKVRKGVNIVSGKKILVK